MIPVEEARRRIVTAFRPLAAETVSIAAAAGRVLAEDVAARRMQPPSDLSAMDGYAVRGADVADAPATLVRIGEVQAGTAFAGTVGPGQCVRIFTGAALAAGTDTVVLQEDTEARGDTVVVREATTTGRHVRPAGLDFRDGDVLLRAGRLLTSRDIGLAAAMNVPWLRVRRRPRVAVLSTGDELALPGDPIGANQIACSSGLALGALVRGCGGEVIDLGIARDDRASLLMQAEGATGADLLLTTGGASVGDYDLVRSVLGEAGLELDFWQIAIRPGKPLLFGRLRGTPVIGLPGNPVSSAVCALVFVRPALAAMLGSAEAGDETRPAILGRALPANDRRQDYLRGSLHAGPDGALVATPFERQDSSMMAVLAAADALIVRPPHAPPAAAGDRVDVLDLRGGAAPA